MFFRVLQELNALFAEIYSVYQHFIGQPHFDALLELLSYQDVAVILKELMESIRSLVCYCLALKVVTLDLTVLLVQCCTFVQFWDINF